VQSTSSNLTNALTGSAVTWDKPKVFVDWAQDGYGAAGSIDDLSALAGPIHVDQALDDGFPDDVTFTGTLGVPEASTTLASPDLTPPSRYWSTFNGSSPMSGYDRDVAPAKIEFGAIGASGAESVRVFTGQMSNLPVRTGKASAEFISNSRLLLSKLVQPPIVSRDSGGANSTWLVSWLLYQCGYYLSPPPQDGCVWWAPMHGGSAPFIGSCPQGFTVTRQQGAVFTYPYAPEWETGPYVLAPALRTGVGVDSVNINVRFEDGLEDGSDFITQSGSKGRVQLWIKGDTIGTGLPGAGYLPFEFYVTAASSYTISVGIADADHKWFIAINDGAKTFTYKAASALPTDGAWYFVGAAWDIAANKVWLNNNGTVTTSGASPAFVTANLPAGAPTIVGYHSWLPIAEFQLNSGTQASPTTNPTWANGVTWDDDTTVVYPASVEYSVICEPVPREAWELLGEVAQANLAVLRIDELDRPCFLPRGYYTQVSTRAVVDSLDTNRHIADIGASYDPSKVRNSVRVEYQDSRLDSKLSPLLQISTIIALAPGVTTLEFALDTPGLVPTGGTVALMTAGQIAAGGLADNLNATSINASYLGVLSYATTQVVVTITAATAGSVTVAFNNKSTVAWYLANDATSVPFLKIVGYALRQVAGAVAEQESTSVALRGERALAVQLPGIQLRDEATHLARQLALELCSPIAVVEDAKAFGDPRRQPGDFVTIGDAKDTGISGTWQTSQVTHDFGENGDYQQTIRAREAITVGTWGVSRWGQARWGYSS
jgi:hypothetical protein